MGNNKLKQIEKVILGLEKPIWTVVASQWQITSDLRKSGFEAIEANYLHTLLPLLIDPVSYTCLLRTNLLDLDDKANCDRALIYKLCKTFPQNMYFVWDSNQKWGERSASDPNNLIVVTGKTKTVNNGLMDYLNKNIEINKIK